MNYKLRTGYFSASDIDVRGVVGGHSQGNIVSYLIRLGEARSVEPEHGFVFPWVSTSRVEIANTQGVSTRTVAVRVRLLREKGYVEVRKKGYDNEWVYRLTDLFAEDLAARVAVNDVVIAMSKSRGGRKAMWTSSTLSQAEVRHEAASDAVDTELAIEDGYRSLSRLHPDYYYPQDGYTEDGYTEDDDTEDDDTEDDDTEDDDAPVVDVDSRYAAAFAEYKVAAAVSEYGVLPGGPEDVLEPLVPPRLLAVYDDEFGDEEHKNSGRWAEMWIEHIEACNDTELREVLAIIWARRLYLSTNLSPYFMELIGCKVDKYINWDRIATRDEIIGYGVLDQHPSYLKLSEEDGECGYWDGTTIEFASLWSLPKASTMFERNTQLFYWQGNRKRLSDENSSRVLSEPGWVPPSNSTGFSCSYFHYNRPRPAVKQETPEELAKRLAEPLVCHPDEDYSGPIWAVPAFEGQIVRAPGDLGRDGSRSSVHPVTQATKRPARKPVVVDDSGSPVHEELVHTICVEQGVTGINKGTSRKIVALSCSAAMVRSACEQGRNQSEVLKQLKGMM